MGFSSRNNLHSHLKKQHGYSSEQAAPATIDGFTLKTYEEWLKVKRTDGLKRKE
jgi:hypothetical protein